MENYNDNSTSWINIADIMSALMMVFMFISVAFIYQLQNEKEIYRVELNKALHLEFGNDLKNWDAEITDENIFRFNTPFDAGSSNVPEKFKSIMSEFFPRYIKVLTFDKFKNEIDEIRVEGHTSYGWGNNASKKEIYLNNMTLSQNRANNVLAFCYQIENDFINKNREWLEKLIRANGMAFSKLIYKEKTNQEQDFERSRRVEFRVLTKEHKNDD